MKVQIIRETLSQKEGKAGEVAQVLACLPSKHEALSSNPSTKKEKKEMGGVGGLAEWLKV
jgi:hypothetical protein